MTSHEPSYNYKATVIKWIDGDTVDLDIDLGFYASVKVRCRLDGIDTPERGTPKWSKATAFSKKQAPAGSKVLIYSKLPVDKYGRFLVDIYKVDEEESINQALVAAGFAVPYDGGTKL